MRSIELFVGAGGLALATTNAGFDHDVVIERDQNACETIRRNKAAGMAHVRDWRVWQGDVSKYDFRPHAETIEFVSGGPPCQPFSIGGKHTGMDDRRNMFPHAVRAIREIAPKAFLFENVRGLLRKSFANYYSYIIHQLTYPEIARRGDEEWTDHLARLQKAVTGGKQKGLRYNVVYQVLDAADFGVPQRRHRVMIVGVLADLGIRFGFPSPTHEEDALIYSQWVSGDYWERHRVPKRQRPRPNDALRAKIERISSLFPRAMLKPWLTVRDAISDLPQIGPGERCNRTPNHFFNPGARVYAGHDGSPLDWPAKALKAGDHGVPGGENMLRLHDGSVRYFSVRECARIQTFPDEWVLEGSWTESMRQLGNAVPVRMAQTVAAELRLMLRRADHAFAVIRAAGADRSGLRSRR